MGKPNIMEILARFLIYFGGAFLAIGVVIMSFLRRKMIARLKANKRKKRLQFLANQQKNHSQRK